MYPCLICALVFVGVDVNDTSHTGDSVPMQSAGDDDLCLLLTYLRQCELPDDTSISVSKGLLQQILESGMSVVYTR